MRRLRGRSPAKDAAQDFPEYLARSIRESLTGASGDAHEIYAVSFFVYDEEDDPMQPMLTVGWNTETQVEFALAASPDQRPNQWWRPLDGAEARWNYAFWLQNGSPIGNSRSDEQGCALKTSWLKSQNAWLADPPLGDGEAFDRFLAVGDRSTQLYLELCVEEAQGLHQDGIIASVFGRPIPIIVHELEYYDAVAARTRSANPTGLADEFIAWVEHLG